MVVLKLAAAYGGALAARPLETKIATGAIVAGLGDALAQLCDPSTESFSWPRSQCFVGFGGLYTGAWQHFCFGWLTTHCTGVGVLPGYASAPPQPGRRRAAALPRSSCCSPARRAA